MDKDGARHYRVPLIRKQRLSEHTLELGFERPEGFDMQAGQMVTFFDDSASPAVARDYTLVNAPDSGELTICVRFVAQGRFSPRLVHSPLRTEFEISKPFGYFTFQPSLRLSVFVATGTGIAPFVAYVRSGVSDFIMLHGVHNGNHLYYRRLLAAAAQSYIPCLSAATAADAGIPALYSGRVTGYLEEKLPSGEYDFYLCGRGKMIEEAIAIIDRRFSGALVFSEPFF